MGDLCGSQQYIYKGYPVYPVQKQISYFQPDTHVAYQ